MLARSPSSASREKQKLADGGGTRAPPSKQPIMELAGRLSNPVFRQRIADLLKLVPKN